MMTAINEDSFPSIIIKGSLALLAFLAIAGTAFFSKKIGLGILVGGLIAVINFIWMHNVLQRTLVLLPAKPALYSQLKFMARITVTGIVLYALITSGWFSLAGLLVGLSVIVANIIALSLYCALRTGG